jgi:wyosine [tRNA(Phe)-imidazoG37] synthetase (radical SAM superfamily)
MSTILFDKIIFGPVKSRRLGISLGINLLPLTAKICTFNCIYCECGFNTTDPQAVIPTREEVRQQLEITLSEMKNRHEPLDVITFAGNGEPTIHKDFATIVDDTIALRNTYFPNAGISVLSNSTQLDHPSVVQALNKVDNNILKLDSANDHTIQLLNRPVSKKITAQWLIEHLQQFHGNVIIQTMFLHGETDHQIIDNTTDEEVELWLAALKQIKPKQVMIYTIDRETPLQSLRKATHEELTSIAQKVKEHGFDVLVGE